MSNNKQSMKLYTEEELRKAIELSRDTHQEGKAYMERDEYDYSMDEVVDSLTPIELPSDEEIEKEARLYCNIKESLVIDEEERYYKDFQKYDGFKACAKWMRDKIQGGNK